MFKCMLAGVGFVAIVGGIAIGQIGFFSEKTQDVSKQVDRAVASVRADKLSDNLRAEIASLDEKARHYDVEARKMELAWEREQKGVDQYHEAIVKLTTAAKNAGLPKASDAPNMTEDQKNVKLTFGDKEIFGRDLYKTLDDWNDQYKTKSEAANIKKTTIDRMRETADKIRAKQTEMKQELAKLDGRVKELQASKDLAKINAELAEMEANVNGINVGKSGKALQIIEEQIDELNAQADTYQAEAQTKKGELNPIDVIAPTNAVNELDQYWN